MRRATVICQHTQWLQFVRNTVNSVTINIKQISIAFKWTAYAVPSVPFMSLHTLRYIEISCLFFLEWFCVAILCNVTLHTCNIHIHEITAVNTTITIMTKINGQQWQGSLLFYKRVAVHRSGKYRAFGPCITLSLHTVVYWSTLHDSLPTSLWLHHFYFSITMNPEWSVWHNLWNNDTKRKILCKNKSAHDNTQDILFSSKAKTFLPS